MNLPHHPGRKAVVIPFDLLSFMQLFGHKKRWTQAVFTRYSMGEKTGPMQSKALYMKGNGLHAGRTVSPAIRNPAI